MNTQVISRATRTATTSNGIAIRTQVRDVWIRLVKNTIPKILTSNAVVTKETAHMKVMMIATLANLKITPSAMVTAGAMPRR